MVRDESAKMTAWRGRIRRFEKSAMTVPQFCEAEGVSRSAFYIWRKKVQEQSRSDLDEHRAESWSRDPQPVSARFASVVISAAHPPVAVRLPGDVCIEVPADNLAALQAVVAEVMQRATTAMAGDSQC